MSEVRHARPNIVVFDPWEETTWSYARERAILEAEGLELGLLHEWTPEALVDIDVLLVHEQSIGAVEIEALQRCVGIVTYSVGTNQVDQIAAKAAGITVRNCPTFCTEEVADHAMALVLAVERRLIPMDAAARAGEWDQFRLVGGLRRLQGQTMGILGAGRIGRRVAARARAFGFRTIACDPFVTDPDPDLPLVDLPQLVTTSDVLVICASLSPGGGSLIDEDALHRLRRGAVIINVSRGGVIDEAALADALRDGRVAAVGLDVRTTEPPMAGPLDSLPNVLLTPHVAGLSEASLEALHDEAATTALELLRASGRLA